MTPPADHEDRRLATPFRFDEDGRRDASGAQALQESDRAIDNKTWSTQMEAGTGTLPLRGAVPV